MPKAQIRIPQTQLLQDSSRFPAFHEISWHPGSPGSIWSERHLLPRSCFHNDYNLRTVVVSADGVEGWDGNYGVAILSAAPIIHLSDDYEFFTYDGYHKSTGSKLQ